MILIFSEELDWSSNYVIDWILSKDSYVLRLNTDNLQIKCDVIFNEKISIVIEFGQSSLNVSDIFSILKIHTAHQLLQTVPKLTGTVIASGALRSARPCTTCSYFVCSNVQLAPLSS